MIRAPLLMAALLLVPLSGCLDDAPPPPLWQPASYDHETAVYDYTLDGIRIATVEVALDRAPMVAELKILRHAADTPFGSLSAGGETYRVHMDDETGLKTRITSPEGTHHPWGTYAALPNAGMALITGMQGPLEMSALPLGPQWAAAASTSGGPIDWGPMTVQTGHDRRTVTATAPCDGQCLEDKGETWTTVMELDRGLLPQQVTMTGAGLETTLAMTRTEHHTEGGPIPLAPQAPKDTTLDTAPLCGGLLCEPADWPLHLSLQYGHSALAAHPTLTDWLADHPDAYLAYAGVSPGGGYIVLEQHLVHLTKWSFRYADPGGEVFLVSVEASYLPDGSLGPPTVTRTSTDTSRFTGQWPDEIRFTSLQETTDNILDAADASLEDVVRLYWENDRPDPDADPRGWSSLRLIAAQGAETWHGRGSPSDGALRWTPP